MATALTGQLGLSQSQLGLVQLGGPAYAQSFARPLPVKALPLLGHAYANDGVTPNSTSATFSILNRPAIKATTTNGGYDALTIEVAAPVAGLSQGNVIRLSEVGGPFRGFVYGGIAEAFPGTVSPTGTKHEITLAPFGVELGRVYSQALYTLPTDVSQAVRDAVALTQHCSCDQVSVPASTGILLSTTPGGQVDFRNQTVQQILDTCRSIAGAAWHWFCDELGRVWFQPMGSGAVYTIPQAQYAERVSNGGSIVDRKNQVVAVGGVPTGGSANIQATYNGSSQSGPNGVGIRALNPALSIPNITDLAALQNIANNVGAVLDRVWNRIQVKATPAFPQRIHASQPGGAMVRTWEPAKTPMAESEAGAGYAGPYIAQEIIYDGLFQQVTAGDIPVTSQTDVDNMVKSLISRAAANSLQVTAAALNLNQQVFTGTFQSGTGTFNSPSQGIIPAALWALNQQMFAAYDPSGVRRVEMGNLLANGVSPAQWGFRANDGSGNPIFDSLGLIAVMQQLGRGDSGATSYTTTTPTVVTGTPVTFTLARTTRVLALFSIYGFSSTNNGHCDLYLDGTNMATAGASALAWYGAGGPSVTSSNFYSDALPAGSHTIDLRAYLTATPGTFSVNAATLIVWRLGT